MHIEVRRFAERDSVTSYAVFEGGGYRGEVRHVRRANGRQPVWEAVRAAQTGLVATASQAVKFTGQQARKNALDHVLKQMGEHASSAS